MHLTPSPTLVFFTPSDEPHGTTFITPSWISRSFYNIRVATIYRRGAVNARHVFTIPSILHKPLTPSASHSCLLPSRPACLHGFLVLDFSVHRFFFLRHPFHWLGWCCKMICYTQNGFLRAQVDLIIMGMFTTDLGLLRGYV